MNRDGPANAGGPAAATENGAAEASHSLWMDVAAFPAKPLAKSMTTDVAIIGSGICGTSVAYELTAKGVGVRSRAA
jgi:ribulose 1,5-bisphosphate synthetase/thiazole synthase